MYKYLSFLGLVLLLSCSSARLNKAIKNSRLDQIHTGIMIEDLNTGKVLYAKNENQFFMPASNMKLLTFLLANRHLKDKTPAFIYQEKNDSLFFWGAGDPSFLHPNFNNQKLIEFLKSSKKELIYAEEKALPPLGMGWAWDDYTDYYSAEISSLPMYGNVVSFTKDQENWTVAPGFFRNSTYFTEEIRPVRDRNENRFFINKKLKSYQSPFLTSPELVTHMLVGLVNKTINYEQRAIPNDAQMIFETPLDSLLRPLMYHSDNMIAEQLLVQMGSQLKISQNPSDVIQSLQTGSKESFLKEIKWVDGSGLSRYNLMRPKDLSGILKAIYAEMPANRWQALLPQAGKSGTLKNITINNSDLKIWAKSGSFANTYNLSGLAKTPKGKCLAFSFMTNLANQSVSESKSQIVQFLNQLASF